MGCSTDYRVVTRVGMVRKHTSPQHQSTLTKKGWGGSRGKEKEELGKREAERQAGRLGGLGGNCSDKAAASSVQTQSLLLL